MSKKPQKKDLPEKTTPKTDAQKPGSKAKETPNSVSKEVESHKASKEQSKSLSPHKEGSLNSLAKHGEVEAKIKSRKRILETLEEQTSFCNDEVVLQLNSRDSLIEELNREIVSLKARIKQEKKKEGQVKKQNESQKISELESEKNLIENKYIVIVDKYRNEISKLEEEKLNFEVTQDTLKEEIEILKTQVKSKDQELGSVIADVQKLSEIIQQFKNLNNDLNGKIEKQNSEFETMTSKFYEAEVKAASMVEVESSLQDYINSYQRAETRANKLSEQLRSAQILYEDIQAFCKFAEGRLEKVQKEIESDKEGFKIIKELRTELMKKSEIEVPENEEKKEAEKIRNLTDELDRALLKIKQLELAAKPTNDQVVGLKDLIENMKKNHSEALENLKKTSKAIQDNFEFARKEITELRSEVSKKDAKIASISSKLSSSENKTSGLSEKIKKLNENFSALEKENSEFKQKLSAYKNTLSEKNSQLSQLEKQSTKYVLNIQALHEELWKKDTMIIKAKKNLTQIQKTVSHQKTPSKRETNEKLLKELQEKEQKIEILKEMVKVSQIKKDRKGSPENSSFEIHPEKNKVTQDLLHSLAAKTINKFFTLCSFHKNSAQESSQDLQRLVKKLKQDLKSYSNFHVKDLQSSVPQLQYYFFDNKTVISLDELMAAISKAVN